MKTINKIFIGLGLIGMSGLYSCSDFDEVNSDPSKAPLEWTSPEYFLNSAIGKIQMDPSTGERVYYLNWGDAARAFGEAGLLCVGLYDDAYMSNFYYPCLASTITYATTAITEAEKRAETDAFYNNIVQFGRIWRAMVIAQFADSFGPYPLNSAQAENPVFNSEKETYAFILSELKDAADKIDTSVSPTETQANCDPAYKYVGTKWQKLANSLRMRYAMRLTNTDMVADAQKEFEDACKDGNYIKSQDDMLWFTSNNGWDDYTSPYTRTWNLQALSSTMDNLMTNLGGVSVSEQRSDLAKYTHPNTYLGIKYDQHFVGNTDDPMKQYWLDGIPENLDPRALKMFWLVNDTIADNMIDPSSKGTSINAAGGELLDEEGNSMIKISGSYTWNGVPSGASSSWSSMLAKNRLITTASGIRSCYPLWGRDYCTGGETGLGRVVFYGAWESYFLLAEAALQGWNTAGISDEQAYEDGVRASFEYFGVSEYVNEYLNSEEYNRVGTSVKYSHTVEPSSFEATYIDGYTNQQKTVQYQYPVASKTLYGKALNDKLTKIITQKYLAQMPYLVQEAWSDHRRLGLPFFDMTANESVMTGSDMSDWRPNSWESGQNWKYYPQRMRYPETLRTSDEVEYNHALELLGGTNTTMVPLWWSLGYQQK